MSSHVFLICTHGRFGEELIKSAEMIGGQLKNVYAFSLLQGVEPEIYMQQIEEKLKELKGQSIICLVDLFGGTPCNTVAQLTQRYDLQIVTGVNLAMLLEMDSQKNNLESKEVIELGLNTLKESGRDVLSYLKGR